MVWKDLSEKMASVQGLKGSEAASHVKIRRKCIPSRRDYRVKQAPEMGKSLTCSRRSEAAVIGQSGQQQEW